jgi:hypothetical protein
MMRAIEELLAKMEAEDPQAEYLRRFTQLVSLCKPRVLRIESLFWPEGMTRN